MHMQGNIRIAADKLLNDGRQDIPGLSMGGGDGQCPAIRIREFPGESPHFFDFVQHLACLHNDYPAGRGNLGEVFTAAMKDLDTQFVLQHAYLFADPRLRGVKAFRCR